MLLEVLTAIQILIGIIRSVVDLMILIKNQLPNKKRKTATRNSCLP